MIRVARPVMPESFPPKKIQENEAEIQLIIGQAQTPTSSQFRSHWSDYKDRFSKAQFEKCAYCESRFVAAYPGDVEHKRPKAEVCEPLGRGNRDDRTGPPGRTWGPSIVPGYWWLTYRWENWLFSCNRCNNWKGNRFPLQSGLPSASSMQPGREVSEQALLLDPHEPGFSPEEHFSWDEVGGIHDCSPRGCSTIDVCALDRSTLQEERGRVAGQFLRLFDDYEVALAAGAGALQVRFLRQALSFCEDRSPYAAMCRFLLHQRFQLTHEELLGAMEMGILGS